MKALSLYLVTESGSLMNEEYLRIILQAIAGGVTMVQLREKEASFSHVCDMGRHLQAILQPLGVPLIINDRIDVAEAIQADGVHLGQSDLKPSLARQRLGKQALIGLSVETLHQALNAEAEPVDYLAASPVFQTETKRDCSSPWGLTGLKKLCTLSRFPIVAIGGIRESNLKAVIDSGVAGVAVVSAILHARCPETAARKLCLKH